MLAETGFEAKRTIEGDMFAADDVVIICEDRIKAVYLDGEKTVLVQRETDGWCPLSKEEIRRLG